MRFSAIFPVLCCTAALILSFLCLFAGHKKDFMEDYHILTLNTSRIGQNFLQGDSNTGSSTLDSLINKIPDSISNRINDKIGQATEKLGIEDWYSAHLLNYCDGQYTPAEVPNKTVSESSIHKMVSNCSESQAGYKFDPTRIVQEALNKTTGGKVTLSNINWPEDIEDGIRALNAVMTAVFVLYVISICLIFVALVAAVAAILASGRLTACVNGMVALLAFLAVGIASALVTALGVKATEVINEHGGKVGLEARKGGKFLALTWAATALMLIVTLQWIVELFVGKRQKAVPYAKHG